MWTELGETRLSLLSSQNVFLGGLNLKVPNTVIQWSLTGLCELRILEEQYTLTFLLQLPFCWCLLYKSFLYVRVNLNGNVELLEV